MIAVELTGGLGNQMFQYATGRSIAIHGQTQLKIDLSWFKNPDAFSRRTYELGCFKIQADLFEPQSLGPKRVWFRRSRNELRYGDLKLINEPHFQFYPDLLKASDNVYLKGYWQSEKYFEQAKPQIYRDFQFKSSPSFANKSMLDKIGNSQNPVSLHIRRGDYVADKKTNEFHGTASLEYYDRAIEHISKNIQTPTFFVFSDDPKWCRQNLKLNFPTTFVDHNPPTSGYEDMRLMSTCKHHILANSSFSWWGAWLNKSGSKIVIAPKKWFQDPTINTKDLIPKKWVRL